MTDPAKPAEHPRSAILEPQALQAMLEQWPGVVLLLDAQSHLLWCSEAAFKLATSDRDVLRGLSFEDLGMPWSLLPTHVASVLAGAALELNCSAAPTLTTDRDPHQWVVRARRIDLSEAQPAVLCIAELTPVSVRTATQSECEQSFDAAQAGIWRWHLSSDEASVDEAWCRQHKLDACSGAHHLVLWSSQMHPDDSALYRRRLTELRSGANGYFEAEYRILTRENSWLWILQRGRVVARDALGAPSRVIGICIDIDQRKREETASKTNESRLATALWGARAAFWQWHVPTDTRTMSPMWYAMTRYTREQWEGLPTPWFSRVHAEDGAAVEAAMREYRSGATDSLEYEYRLLTAGGDWKWILDRARAVEWDLEGNPAVIMGVSLDIDAQKRVDVELRSSETRLQTAVWGARMGLWESDLALNSTRWFDQWCEQYGIDPCDGPDHARRWMAHIHPADVAGVAQRYEAHLAGKQDFYDSEYRIMTTSGVWRWIFCRARVTERDDAGHARRVVGVCMDVDARRREQMQQHFTQPWLETALSVARGGMWHWQIEPHAVTYTDTYYRLFGSDPLEGRNDQHFWLHRIHPEDSERVRQIAWDTVAGRREQYEAEYRMHCADERYIWVLDRACAIGRDCDGKAQCLVGCIIDVTERRAEKEALRASEERFRYAAVAAQGMIYEVHCPSGASEQRFGAEGVIGYQPDEIALTREAWLALVHPDDLALFLAARPLDNSLDCADELEYRVRHKAGHWVRVRDRGVTVATDNGRPARRVGFVQAVTAASLPQLSHADLDLRDGSVSSDNPADARRA